MRKIALILLCMIISVISANINAYAIDNLPTTFSAVEQGWVTSVKNQGDTASCTAHSVTSTVESALLSQGYSDADSLNLSELHFIYCAKTIFSNSLGLNIGDTGYYLSLDDLFYKGYPIEYALTDTMRNVGLVNENEYNSLDKYKTYEEYIKTLTPEEKSDYINNSEFQVNSFFVSSDMNTNKKHIMKYGSMIAGYYHDSEYMKTSLGSTYYFYNKIVNHNHAICIVGWDDSISKYKFTTDDGHIPDGNGAWLVKNSYGTGFGDNGYMWISYYDKSLTEFCGLTCTYKESDDYYDSCYQYDSGGNYIPVKASKFANTFVSDSDEILKAISYMSDKSRFDFTLQIYKNNNTDNPESGELIYEQAYKHELPGYKMIKLDNAIELKKGTVYSIVIETNDNNSYLNAEHSSYSDCIKIPEAGRGESFIYNKEWIDISTTTDGTKNIAIKAYTDEAVYTDEVKSTSHSQACIEIINCYSGQTLYSEFLIITIILSFAFTIVILFKMKKK